MASHGICSNVKARRITVKFGTLYKENFWCRSCNCFISPLGIINQNGIRCTCCKQRVRKKSDKKCLFDYELTDDGKYSLEEYQKISSLR